MAKAKPTKKKPVIKQQKLQEVSREAKDTANEVTFGTVRNPFTMETEDIKIYKTGFDAEMRQVAQGFSPLSGGQFSVLLEMKKFPHESQWTVTGAPLNPIR